MHFDPWTGRTYLAFWDVSFHPVNASVPAQRWHVYELVWGAGALPMAWPGPPQIDVDCSSKEKCRQTCPAYVECPSDGWFYCCADALHCAAQHACAGAPDLRYCGCGPGR